MSLFIAEVFLKPGQWCMVELLKRLFNRVLNTPHLLYHSVYLINILFLLIYLTKVSLWDWWEWYWKLLFGGFLKILFQVVSFFDNNKTFVNKITVFSRKRLFYLINFFRFVFVELCNEIIFIQWIRYYCRATAE